MPRDAVGYHTGWKRENREEEIQRLSFGTAAQERQGAQAVALIPTTEPTTVRGIVGVNVVTRRKKERGGSREKK